MEETVEVSELDPFLSCCQSGGRVVSQVFCLPRDYRKDLLPSGKSQYLTMDLPGVEILSFFHAENGLNVLLLFEINKNINPVPALSALTVSFKLPISEISEIDDHKSVIEN